MNRKKKYLAAAAAALTLTACGHIGESVPDNKKSLPADVTLPYESEAPWTAEQQTTFSVKEETPAYLGDISLTYYELTLNKGESSMPKVTMDLEDDSDLSEIWSSSDENIAEVDQNGNITAVSAGSCIVTVRSAAYPSVSADVEVRVRETEGDRINEIELSFYTVGMEVDDTVMPYVTMYPEGASDKSEIWSSSDESVATVDEIGNITAVSEGRCTITVKSAAYPDISRDVTVIVSEDRDDIITGISLSFNKLNLEVGETDMPYVTMYPEDAGDRSEIWSSSDETVAAVDGKGNITALSAGKCVVTVRSAAYPEVSACVDVTVREKEIPRAIETESSGNKNEIKELTYINGILVVNKTYGLPADYAPGVDPEAKQAFEEMSSDAAAEGLNLYISSGFRSYEYQQGLYQRYVDRSGQEGADRYSARAGYSEHQTGLAFDLNTIDSSFADTDEYVWLKKHCAEYGFIIRYPADGESSTGYMYEPWHIRYLGKETAQKVYDSGLTLEDYLGITSKYSE